jgi:hypothetical protein
MNMEKLAEKKDVKGLIKAISNRKDSGIRLAAASALGEMAGAEMIRPLQKALLDTNTRVRAAARDALNRLCEDRLAVFQSREPSVCAEAAKALGLLGDARAVEPLIEALAGEFRHMHRVAVEIVGETDNCKLETILRFLEPLKLRNAHVNLIAIREMELLINSASVYRFIGNVRDYANLKNAAAEALGHLNDRRAMEPLQLMVQEGIRYKNKKLRQIAQKSLKLLNAVALT